MRAKEYRVYLTVGERMFLEKVICDRGASFTMIKRAHILLSLDENMGGVKTQVQIAGQYGSNPTLVRRVAKQYVNDGLESVLTRKKRATPPTSKKITDEMKHKIIRLANSKPPEGRARWTLWLLEQKVVELGISDKPISYNTIGRLLRAERLNGASGYNADLRING